MPNNLELMELIKSFVDLNVQTYSCHDRRDFNGLENASSRALALIGIPQSAAEEGGKIVSNMYQLYDEAVLQLKKGDDVGHSDIFSKIYAEAHRLDLIIGIKRGSTADEVQWWYHFSLAFDKTKPWIRRVYNWFAAFVAAFSQHRRRLGSIRYGFICAFELAREGLAHKNGDAEKERYFLNKYWSAKVEGNGFRVEPEIFSM